MRYTHPLLCAPDLEKMRNFSLVSSDVSFHFKTATSVSSHQNTKKKYYFGTQHFIFFFLFNLALELIAADKCVKLLRLRLSSLR